MRKFTCLHYLFVRKSTAHAVDGSKEQEGLLIFLLSSCFHLIFRLQWQAFGTTLPAIFSTI
jgi:hypothetical protein